MDKAFVTKLIHPVKSGQPKSFDNCFHIFLLLLPKFNFWKGELALGYASNQISDFSDISYFFKVLRILTGKQYPQIRLQHFRCW